MRAVVLAWIMLGIGILAGCGGAPDRPTAPVSGEVGYRGQPLDHGPVVFIHESGHGAAGQIGPDGKYTLEAHVGANAVLIECLDPNAATTVPGRPNMALPASLIPQRYGDHMKSALTFQVQSGDNRADFALEE